MATQDQYIPYLRVGKVGLDTAAAPALSQGEMRWNNDEECFDFQMNQAVWQGGLETFYHVRNGTASTIPDGTPVMATGTVGNSGRITVAPMDGTNTANARYLLGFATYDIAANNAPNGYDAKVTSFGKVRGINTTGALSQGGLETWNDGDVLYIDPANVGKLTKVAPTQPDLYMPVAFVVHAHTNGTLHVRITNIDESRFGPSFGNVKAGNYSTFESDGTLVSYGAATTYDDVYPSSVTVGVGGTAPSFTAYNGNLKAYEFTGGVSNKELHIGYQLYHSYKEGANISPHLHLFFTSGAADIGSTIIFDCEYTWTNVDQEGAVATQTLTGTYTIGANSTVYNNEIFSYTGAGSGTGLNTPIVGTGKTISSIVMTRVVRRQDLDTFTGSCWLKSADIHIEQDTRGSRQILIK